MPGVAPDHLSDADRREDSAIDGPVIVTDHKANAKGEVETLEHPDDTHEDHDNSDHAADDAHHLIECRPRRETP